MGSFYIFSNKDMGSDRQLENASSSLHGGMIHCVISQHTFLLAFSALSICCSYSKKNTYFSHTVQQETSAGVRNAAIQDTYRGEESIAGI